MNSSNPTTIKIEATIVIASDLSKAKQPFNKSNKLIMSNNICVRLSAFIFIPLIKVNELNLPKQFLNLDI